MANDINIRTLGARDLRGVVDLVRSSFDVELLPFMIYGQHGVQRYLELSLPRAGVIPARESVVAEDATTGQSIGYAEFDVRNSSSPHLSYICVAPSHRGKGVALQLIDHFVSAHPNAVALTLDVFEGNEAAQSLYARLGFDTVTKSVWAVRPLPLAEVPPIVICDLPQSLAVHDTFGFSKWQVAFRGRQLALGRLGDTCVRVDSPEDFLDDPLLAAMRAAFTSSRYALVIAPEGVVGSFEGCGWNRLAVSIRMTTTLITGESGRIV